MNLHKGRLILKLITLAYNTHNANFVVGLKLSFTMVYSFSVFPYKFNADEFITYGYRCDDNYEEVVIPIRWSHYLVCKSPKL